MLLGQVLLRTQDNVIQTWLEVKHCFEHGFDTVYETAHSLNQSHEYFPLQVFSYDKIASSPATSLSQLYHKLLDTTHIPPLNLSKEYKNQLYLSVTEWENKLMQISVDAVNEECAFVINNV